MKWWKVLTWWYRNRTSIGFTFEVQRADINSNTSDCAKLLYRLEEAELQIRGLQMLVKTIQEEEV